MDDDASYDSLTLHFVYIFAAVDFYIDSLLYISLVLNVTTVLPFTRLIMAAVTWQELMTHPGKMQSSSGK